MNKKEILTDFSNNFVNKSFRTRFVHEAIKKPNDLHRRICHEIDKVFNDKYKSKKHSFKENESCLYLGWFSHTQEMTWSEAKELMSQGGGGYLVINTLGTKFYAETEEYPAVIYAGQG